MSVIGNESDFLNDYWQKKPKVYRDCFNHLQEVISGDDLAGLACENEVESRIISGLGLNDPWCCRQGPFVEDDFSDLDDKNWTLLVQGVDQWDSEIRSVLAEFRFLPSWRLDDVMASYAPMGGGVGPHFDNYDVFLIQAGGSRQWKIGQRCDNHTKLQENSQVKLLAEFECELIFELNPGDMIYVPAGVAHWGTAVTDDCITLSVGFRAPSDKQLICQTLENLLEYFSDSSDQETCFYQDTTSSMDLISAKINQNAHLSIDNLLTSLTPEILQAESHRAFGQLVTEPRQRVEIEYDKEWTAKEVENLLKSSNFIAITQLTHSRLAFSEDTLFVNGQTYTVAESFSNMLCDGGISRLLSENEMDIFLELLNQGAITIN